MKPLTPRHREFKAALEDLRDVDEAELADAMARIDPAIRARLAEGPHPRRWTCGVCEAVGAGWYRDRKPDRSDPLWIVWAYHEVPKADMNHSDQLHYGELANQTYRRCIATYRAAGWTGDAAEPNA